MSEIILACIFPNHLYCYWFVRSLISSLIRRSWNSCLEFQGCHVVNFSRFFMFSPLSDNFYMLSHLKFFVNNFFIFFQDLFGCWCPTSSATTSKYYHTEVCMSTTFFIFFVIIFQWQKNKIDVNLCRSQPASETILNISQYVNNYFQKNVFIVQICESLAIVYHFQHLRSHWECRQKRYENHCDPYI